MNPPTDWLSASAIVAAGLVLGSILIFALRRRKGIAKDDDASELAAKRDALILQLRELDEAGVVDSEARTRLELETADVLRALDRCGTPVKQALETRAPRPMLKGFAWGVACSLTIGAIGFYALSKSDEKPVPHAAPQTAQGIEQLEQAVQNDPGDIEQRIALAKAYFAKDDLMGTFEQTKAALAQNPNEPRALTYNAIVRMAMGQLDDARVMLQIATKQDPKLLDAWVALASVHMQAGDAKAAGDAIDNAIKQHPEEEARLREVLAQIRSQKPSESIATTVAATPSNLPPDHPPLRMNQPKSATSPIRITLSLAGAARAKNGIVYIIARAEGESGGHPVAVKRIDAASFPLSVELSDADSMMGNPLPSTVRVDARLDSDGDAATVDAADPSAFVEGVRAGAALMLKLE